MKYTYYTMLLCLVLSCTSKTAEKSVISAEDYNSYLENTAHESLKTATESKEFWSQRLAADTSGVGEIGPLSGAYTSLFDATGNVQDLKEAEILIRKGLAISANDKEGFARSLAHNLIAQHRFKEAREVLEQYYSGPSNKKDTEYMLFDVYMENGEYEKADTYLGKIKANGDYNYLIRLAKWSDFKGDLDAAIKYMEKAKDVAESRNSSPLMIWTYSNLGDFYGHAGRIEDAYNMYLKTLELQPDNAYAKRGIAWIAYASEKDTEEANRILDSIMVQHKAPDYYLLKAEMAEYNGNTSEATAFTNKFVTAVSQPQYGAMYNAYLIEIYSEEDPQRALEMAKQEVANRATPETYHLLALAQLKAGNEKEALQTIQDHVVGKTFEPMAAYHTALVYKANGMEKEVAPLKEDLLTAEFELGPVLTQKVRQL
ncbi:tetratricopeptide repeat protein [Altibacter sp.]|uniref:tetratricopeptide repeat protein n=1 Tax=Altibacter sp. TaxID=2024823 RepID=UPI000C91FE61|nr:tetratricopeptide repeat protein [Altibacter sp.]MAP55009.1 cell surface protein [Altibacter sp.]